MNKRKCLTTYWWILCWLLLPGVSTGQSATALLERAEAGDVEAVDRLLQEGADPNAADEQGVTPLFAAVAEGHAEVTLALLEGGAEIDGGSINLVLIAARLGHPRVASVLLAHGADPNAADARGTTPLGTAAGKGHVEVVRVLLEQGADPDPETGALRASPLAFAASQGHAEVVRLLLEHGAPPRGMAVWSALGPERTEELRILLEAGADLDLVDEMAGETPLLHAISNGLQETARLLLDAGADPDIPHAVSGRSALRIALEEAPELVPLLLEAGADPDGNPPPKGGGLTPLGAAVLSGQAEAVELLLAYGANPNRGRHFDRPRMTPLDLAIEHDHMEMVQMLLGAGADPNRAVGWSDESTPLDRALRKDAPTMAKMLFAAGGDPHIRTYIGLALVDSDGGGEKMVRHKSVEIASGGIVYRYEYHRPLEATEEEHEYGTGQVVEREPPDESQVVELEPPDEEDQWLMEWVRRLDTDEVTGLTVEEGEMIVPKSGHTWAEKVERFDILWLPEPTADLEPFERSVIEISEEEDRYVFRTYPASLEQIGRHVGPGE